jgi:hypothetical protein
MRELLTTPVPYPQGRHAGSAVAVTLEPRSSDSAKTEFAVD